MLLVRYKNEVFVLTSFCKAKRTRVTLKKRSFFNNYVFVITSFCKALLLRYKNVVFVITSFCKASRTLSEHQLHYYKNKVFVNKQFNSCIDNSVTRFYVKLFTSSLSLYKIKIQTLITKTTFL